MAGPVLILGAGATRACGGPLTDEILPQAFKGSLDVKRVKPLEEFLVDTFHVPHDRRARDVYPPLPLLLSLIDTSLALEHPLSSQRSIQRLREVRSAIEYAIFAVIHQMLFAWATFHYSLIFSLFVADNRLRHQPRIISLNYDVLIDNALLEFGRGFGFKPPDYGCDIEIDRGWDATFGVLLKLHGSLNWAYCPGCHYLQLDTIDKGGGIIWTRKLIDLYTVERTCQRCNHTLHPVLVTPTAHKTYSNPHIQSVWYRAEKELRRADEVYFVGYSLPSEDVEVIHLLKRGTQHLAPNKMTVVDLDPDRRTLHENPVGRRYAALFGEVNWSPLGLEGWLEERGAFARAPRRKRRRKGS